MALSTKKHSINSFVIFPYTFFEHLKIYSIKFKKMAFFICICMCRHAYKYRSEDDLEESALSDSAGFRHQTQIWPHLYLLIHHVGPDYLDSHQVGLSLTNFSSYPYLKQYILDWLSTLLRIKILFLCVIKTMESGYRKCISTYIYHSYTMEDFCFQRPIQINTVPRQVS